MYTHPQLSLRLAQDKIEEAQAEARRASAADAATLNRRVSGLTAGNSWAAPKLLVRRSRARRRSLGTGVARATKG